MAAGLASKCIVQISYAIGMAKPTSLYVNLCGTSRVSNEALEDVISRIIPITPAGIIDGLQLRRPIYLKTSAYGHFGRQEPEFSWERTDKVKEILAAVGLAS